MGANGKVDTLSRIWNSIRIWTTTSIPPRLARPMEPSPHGAHHNARRGPSECATLCVRTRGFWGCDGKNEAVWPCCTDMFGVYCGKLPWHIAATGSNLRPGSAEHLLMVHPSARAVYMPLQISPLMGWRLSCNPATVETQDTMAMPVFLLHPPLISPFDGVMPCPEFDFSMVPARYSTGTLR